MSKARRRPRRKDKTRSEGKPVSWLARLRLALPGIVVTVFLVFLFSHLGVLNKLQNAVLDANMRRNEPPAKSDVVVVKITDDDYQKLFYGSSPLSPVALGRLIEAVSLGRPKVIGVDLDTSAPQFKNLPLPSPTPLIIWERNVKELPESVEEKPEPLEVLGGRDHTYTERFSGLTLLIDDAEDKVTRRYRRVIETTKGPLDSFVWAVVKAFHGTHAPPTKDDARDLYIRYYDDREGGAGFRLSASRVMEMTRDGMLPDDNPFRDKIVLIGGAYLGQDLHDTPVGRRNGVDILARTIETELGGGGDPAPGRVVTIFLEIFEGILTVFLFHFFKEYGLSKALWLNALAVVALALACSYIAAHSTWGITYFIPLLLCVLIFEFAVEYRNQLVQKVHKILSGAEIEIIFI
jgi:CHASE2 domain-containing sensor protein